MKQLRYVRACSICMRLHNSERQTYLTKLLWKTTTSTVKKNIKRTTLCIQSIVSYRKAAIFCRNK